MATRGRKPDPPKLKATKANQRRAAGPFAGIREGGDPPKPETIAADPVASAEWDRVVGLLSDRRILSPADMAILAAYCSAWSTVCRCREILRPNRVDFEGELIDPLVTTNFKSGVMKAHPAVGILAGAERSLASFASELGLSPTARGRVTALEDLESGPESKLSRFMK